MIKTRYTASVRRGDAKIDGATGNRLAVGSTFLPKSRERPGRAALVPENLGIAESTIQGIEDDARDRADLIDDFTQGPHMFKGSDHLISIHSGEQDENGDEAVLTGISARRWHERRVWQMGKRFDTGYSVDEEEKPWPNGYCPCCRPAAT